MVSRQVTNDDKSLLKNLEHNLTLNNLSNKKIGVVTNKYRLLNGKESVWFWDKVHFEKVAQYVHRLVMPINHYGYNGFSELVGDSHFQKDFKGFSPLKFTSKFHYIRAISKTMRDLSATSGVQEKLFLSVMSEAGQSNSYHTEYETLKNAVDALLYLPGSHKPSGMALFKVLDDSTPGQSQWDQFLKIFPARDCTDQDGDGYGEGVDCLGTDCNDKDKNYDDNCPCLHPTVTKSCTNGWCTIPRGCSTMGSPYEEGGRYAIEHPHQVRLTYDFEIQSTEVTQGQFKALMGYNNSSFSSCGDDCPVEQVAWYEAIAYCNALSKSKGYEECFECTSNGWMLNDCKLKSRFSKPQECKGYRLPTEAEWEYAARAGTVTAFYNGDIYTDYDNCKMEPNLDKIGWYCGNSGDKTHKVGQKQANSWGLYDMSGNVEEWVWDRFSTSLGVDATDPVGPSSGSNRFVRGGSWNSGAVECRLAFRMGLFPSVIERNLGFRPCKTLGN